MLKVQGFEVENFEYNDNYKNILDLYLDNSCTEKGLLGNKSVDDSMSEFALGKCAMVQNGNWAWSQIKDVNGNVVKQDDIKFLPSTEPLISSPVKSLYG